MDQTDEKILEILEQNSRKSYTKIAEQLKVSEGTIRNRIKKLKQKGKIQKFTIERGNSQYQAFVLTQVNTDFDFTQTEKLLPNQVKHYEVAGSIDLIIEIQTHSKQKLNQLVDQIREIKGVKETETQVVLS